MATDIKALAEQMVEAVRTAVAKSEAAMNVRIDEILAKVKEIPSVKGDPGKDADPEITRAFVAEAIAALPKPKDGKDFDPEAITRAVAAAVEALPKPKDGKDADLAFIKRLVDETVAALPKPKDGKDADPALMRQLAEEAVKKAWAPGLVELDSNLASLFAKVSKQEVERQLEVVVAKLPKPVDGKDADPAVMKAAIAEAIAKLPVLEEIQRAVAAAVAELPKPKDGKDADMGAVYASIKADVERAVADLPKPKDGRDVDQAAAEAVVRQTVKDCLDKVEVAVKKAEEELRQLVASTVEVTFSKLPKPKDGKDADAETVKLAVLAVLPAMLKEAVAALPKPKDGKDADPVHPDTIARMAMEAVQKIPLPKNGEPGRDALALEILPSVDESKSYPRGTFAEHRGGIIRAIRNTDPVNGSLEKAGWVVSMNGIFSESEETLDEGRTIKRTTTYTDGRQSVREIKTFCMLYKQVWKPGEYERGDVVTWDGSAWHCQEKTMDKPGSSPAWRMMVKQGRAGKDAGTEGPPPAPKPVKLK